LGLVCILIGVWKLSFVYVLIGRFFLGAGLSGITISAWIGVRYWFPNNFATGLTLMVSMGRITMSA